MNGKTKGGKDMSMKAWLIKCESCGDDVETIRTTTRFCSDKCRVRAKKIRARGRKSCIQCGDPIQDKQDKKYCSDACKVITKNRKRTITIWRGGCFGCDKVFVSIRKKKYCSADCRTISRYRTNKDALKAERDSMRVLVKRKCKECSDLFETSRLKQKFCSVRCNKKHHDRRKEVVRRANVIANGVVDWDISILSLTERDGEQCYICSELMDYEADTNDDFYPSIEHVKPIAKGGTHSWNNVKLAHRKCNYEKGDTWQEQ